MTQSVYRVDYDMTALAFLTMLGYNYFLVHEPKQQPVDYMEIELLPFRSRREARAAYNRLPDNEKLYHRIPSGAEWYEELAKGVHLLRPLVILDNILER